MPIDSDAQGVLDQFAKFKVPPIESMSLENARHAPRLKNAVEEMTAELTTARTATIAQPMPQPVGSITHQLIPGKTGDILARVFYARRLRPVGRRRVRLSPPAV